MSLSKHTTKKIYNDSKKRPPSLGDRRKQGAWGNVTKKIWPKNKGFIPWKSKPGNLIKVKFNARRANFSTTSRSLKHESGTIGEMMISRVKNRLKLRGYDSIEFYRSGGTYFVKVFTQPEKYAKDEYQGSQFLEITNSKVIEELEYLRVKRGERPLK